MDSEDDYEDRMDTRDFMEQGYATGGYEEEKVRANSSSSSEHGSDLDNPLPVLSPPHTMDIPSVRRPPVPVMVPADRVSTHDLPLAELLAVVEESYFTKSQALITSTAQAGNVYTPTGRNRLKVVMILFLPLGVHFKL